MLKKPELVLGFSDYQPQAKNLAEALAVSFAQVDVHSFPDGESKLTLPPPLPKSIVIYRSLNQPNSKLIELMLAADSAREQGVEHVTLVAPYLCYMRQDKAFNPGEVVSQKFIGEFLSRHFDELLTVDAHLHRVHDIRQAIPVKHAENISAAESIGDYVKSQIDNPLFLGPDEESLQWVESAAKEGDFEFGVATKTRLGDRSVQIHLPDISFNNRNVVILDDMASTGQTIIQAAKQLTNNNVASIHCAVTHALFFEKTTETMHQAGIKNIWSTDSVEHATNTISLAKLLAGAF